MCKCDIYHDVSLSNITGVKPAVAEFCGMNSLYWLYLLLAGLGEVVWSVALHYSEGFKKPTPSVITIVFMLGSFFLLSLAMKKIPLGTAYAVFTGIGAVGAVIYGMMFLGEPRTALRIGFITGIVLCIIGLRMS
jgi:quaternary ammonium compound-resistance protein SugE